MKQCPSCKKELPNDAHFCPRCMYQYPKKEMIVEMPSSKRKAVYISLAVIVLFIMIIAGIIYGRKLIMNGDKAKEIPYSENIDIDYRDALTDYDGVKNLFGKETEPVYWEREFTVYTHGNTVVYVNDEGDVQRIELGFNDEWKQRTQECAIYGISGKTIKDAVYQEVGELGKPDIIYSQNEWYYYFGANKEVTLAITFDEYNRVYKLEYYRLGIQTDSIPYNENLAHDYRYALTDYNSVKAELGEVTDLVSIGEEGLTACEHGNVTVYVDKMGEIEGVSIYYQQGKNPRGAGFYGIDATTNQDGVEMILGKPDIDEGDIWTYYLEVKSSPQLTIYFTDDMVTELSLYRVSAD